MVKGNLYMKKAYILHGCCDEEEFFSDVYPSPSNSHWLPWLQKQLLMQGYLCQTPEMPKPYAADYAAWKTLWETMPLDDETVLVAHSCGCGFLLRWLSENQQQAQKLVMVAPWLDPQRTCGDFLRCTLAKDLAERVKEIHVFYSADEPVTGVEETVQLVQNTYPTATLHQCDKMGHFCFEEMETVEFPELLKVVDS